MSKKSDSCLLIVATIAFLASCASLLPVYPSVPSAPRFLIACISCALMAAGAWIYNARTNAARIILEDTDEKRNIIRESLAHLKAQNDSFREKTLRYGQLEEITGSLSSTLSLDDTIDLLVDSAFTLVARSRGNCMLFLASAQTGRLALVRSRKEEAIELKAKEGDVFDRWVARHTSSLLIEDVSADFRFDAERSGAEYKRAIGSLVSTPLFREHRFLGVLRLDYCEKGYYSAEDLRFLAILADIGGVAVENALLYKHLQELSIKDDLTGLYLRRHIMQKLEEELRAAHELTQPLSVVMVDIDHFKSYNDTFGHMAGDIVLRTMSAWLRDTFAGAAGVVGRFGGEEFIVILARSTKEQAVRLAEVFRERIASTRLVLRRKEMHLTISAGVSVYPVDARNAQDLIARADQALYKAKEAGRNRVCCL